MKNPNRLINEKSPYLLQHAYNPVDWYPWGEEAFEKAKKEDKPIFLSIGYSSCHWCHVMERESFEDEEVAKVLNEYYIPVKVDREERPDIDNLCMNVCLMINGSGGWPLNVFLTSDRKPFFATTYIPRYTKYGVMGIVDLLKTIYNVWISRRDEILNSSNNIIYLLDKYFNNHEMVTIDTNIYSVSSKTIEELLEYYLTVENPNSRKFPTFHNFILIYDYLKANKDEKLMRKSLRVLREIRLGGIYDQVGGGFHRYSTDVYWILPHFEKMLYDQAFGIVAYSLFYDLTHDELLKQTVIEIFEYLISNLLDREGGFLSSEDAESNGFEGEYYTWSTDEIKFLLEDSYLFFYDYFYLEDDGNFLEEATKKKTGKNVLVFKKRYVDSLRYDEYLRIKSLISRLRLERDKRSKPLKDNKVLTDWNGMVIFALALAGILLDREDMIETSKKAAEFIISRLYLDGNLYHRYCDGEVAVEGMLDDYAFLAMGLFQLYQATFDDRYLQYAIEITKKGIEKFFDSKSGGFFISNSYELPIKTKEFSDSSYPSGNSVMLRNVVILYNIICDSLLENVIQRTVDISYSYFISSLLSFTFLLYSINLWMRELNKVIVVDKDVKDAIKIVKCFPTNTLILLKSGYLNSVSGIFSSIKGKGFFVCRGKTCLPEVQDVDDVISRIRNC
ncbi:MAG: thioredoxin domain-containing protein [Brevinematales bacterium]|nr:thioredoxin domain-containing protein [Brevinematales bacterium]